MGRKRKAPTNTTTGGENQENTSELSTQDCGVQSQSSSSLTTEHTSVVSRNGNGNAAVICSSCGQRGHKTAGSKVCTNYKVKYKKNNKKNSSGTALSEWKPIKQPDEYKLVYKEEILSDYVDNRVREQFKHVYEQVKSSSESSSAVEAMKEINLATIFVLLSKGLEHTLFDYVKANVVKAGHTKVRDWEMYSFIAALCFFEINSCSFEIASDFFRHIFLMRYQDVVLSAERFKQILNSLSLYDPIDKLQNSNCWSSNADTVRHIRDFELKVYEPSRKVWVANATVVSLDDELIGSRSKSVQSKSVSERKAGKEGPKNNAIADAYFRFVLGILHNERIGYSQDEAVKNIIDTLCNSSTHNLNDLLVTCDRGYSKQQLWEMLGKKDLPFVMIVNSSPNVGLPYRYTSNLKDGEVVEADFLINDDPLLGREVFGAECSIQLSRNTVSNKRKMIATVFRDYNTSNNKGSTTLRFVSSGIPAAEAKMVDTLVLVKRKIPNGMKKKDILFFPMQSRNKDVNVQRLENLLVSKTRPLTCFQRCADWFILRQFVVTGTMGRKLARHYPLARSLLCSSVEINNEDTQLEDDQSEDIPNENEVIEVNCMEDMDCGQENVTENDDDEVEVFVAEESDDQQPSIDVTDFRESGEVDWNIDKSKKEIGKELRNSWVFKRGLSTQDMKTGQMNEGNIINSMNKEVWCKSCFECGMFQHKTVDYIAVSPDAIGEIEHPISKETVLCSFEFKTRSAPQLVARAKHIRANYGYFFDCNVGSKEWWDAVPYEYRGQVIHQALVLDVDYVVFTVADISRKWYNCVVKVSQNQREAYKTALMKFEGHMQWAHDSLNVNGPPPKVPPEYFDEDDQKVLSTHLRLWRAVHKKIREDGHVLFPVYIIKSLAQTLYNFNKGGVDGSTQYISALSVSSKFKLDIETKIAVRSIKHIVCNAIIVYRIYKVMSDIESSNINFEEEGLVSLRRKMNNFPSIVDSCVHLIQQLLPYSAYLQNPTINNNTSTQSLNSTPVVASDSTSSNSIAPFTQDEIDEILKKKPSKKRSLINSYYSVGRPKQMRLDNHKHRWIKVGNEKSKRCLICYGKTEFQCSKCNVFLHTLLVQNFKVTCWDKFHNNERIISVSKEEYEADRKPRLST